MIGKGVARKMLTSECASFASVPIPRLYPLIVVVSAVLPPLLLFLHLRRWRFSLKGLLIAVALVSVGLLYIRPDLAKGSYVLSFWLSRWKLLVGSGAITLGCSVVVTAIAYGIFLYPRRVLRDELYRPSPPRTPETK